MSITFLLLGVSSGQALLMTHSEAHVSNIQIQPASGGLMWFMDPWLTVSAASAFDEPSGFDQDYDDDPDFNGEAAASAATSYVSESAAASSNNGTIDVVSDMNVSGGKFFLNSSGFGELFNMFMLTEATPVDVEVSMDYSASLLGQADALAEFTIDYGINLIISDGLTDFTLDTFNVLSDNGSISDSGTLSDTFTLLPGVLYFVDANAEVEDDATVVPEPSTYLLFTTGLAGLLAWQARRKRS